MSTVVRTATQDDAVRVMALIREMADGNGNLDKVRASDDDLCRALDPDGGIANAHVVESDGVIVGYALWYLTYSPWAGRQCMWLSDFYVQPEHRSSGHGRSLMAALAALCISRGYERIDWQVLDTNERGLAFYERLGAEWHEGRRLYQLHGEALEKTARLQRE